MNSLIVARIAVLFIGAFAFMVTGLCIEKKDSPGTAFFMLAIGIICNVSVWFIS